MQKHPPLSAEHIGIFLETTLEAEFSFLRLDDLVAAISPLAREQQDYLLDWVKRISTTNIEIAYQFAGRAVSLLDKLDRRVLETWALTAMDTYDRTGLRDALLVIRNVEQFVHTSEIRTAGTVFEDVSGILLTFVRGLSGRKLKLEQADAPYTDSETLFLPAVISWMETVEDNFSLAKAMVAFQWAQTRFGSFRADLHDALADYPDQVHALNCFFALETLRLEACLARELPGLTRDMLRLKRQSGTPALTPVWQTFETRLALPDASVETTLTCVAEAYPHPAPLPVCYQGELRPDIVAGVLAARLEREKMLLRVKLSELVDDLHKQQDETEKKPPVFSLKPPEEGNTPQIDQFEITLNDMPIAPPDDVRQLITSIKLDLGDIPPEYLTPAGDGEYDPKLYQNEARDPDDVWQGTYHEDGAFLYPEWDCGRKHYRKNWCVLREKDVRPAEPGYVKDVLTRYGGLVKHLRKTFEAMRDENRVEKRQVQGDEVDIDALVEALADARDGSEMSDRLFTRMHRSERNIAVMFMIDMSGSTKGWINDAEREALVLLAEALEVLGDRYAIYGFSGITRKRCEIFRIKRFDESYTPEVKARIAGITPQEYTRMGVAIRHLSKLLIEVEARTKLLITLSDGKPDDYFDVYRGQYGIEDTRQALIEARRAGIHPFCITIDREAKAYLPHMYGAANYIEIDDVKKLPLKAADIYRKLTT
ncbi:nitric oxide reductase activation protein NorD [Sulfuriferula sp.]|uniref:nitric oxide reductase activation protein NorD n=1 Tax=Sulfuriferula sp. TaxID=2025307 RepID=UPI002731355A|nr:VWA domain-containing protein [Sulfuriferula sp.]MDP2027011.1 nitric oxide reductase activation protein [Sulfuriferula sp.]